MKKKLNQPVCLAFACSPFGLFRKLMALTALLAGCASIEPALEASASPEVGAAYVAGQFSRTNSGGFAFVLTNMASGTEYALSLGEDTLLPTDVSEQIVVIKIPPGKYSVLHWFTYGTLTKERSGKHPMTNSFLRAPFELKADSIVFLGSYLVNTSVDRLHVTWSVTPRAITTAEAGEMFRKSRPLFSGLEFRCHLCRF